MSADVQENAAIYRAGDGWRWRAWAAENGEIIGMSSEAYEHRKDAEANLTRLTHSALLPVLETKSGHAVPGATYLLVPVLRDTQPRHL